MADLDRTGWKILLIAPAYNEEGKVGQVVKGADRRYIDEVVIVDDGSRDQTAAEARAAGATVLVHEQNAGVGAALRTGYKYAIEQGYHIAVVMGADCQDKPDELQNLLRPIICEQKDFVQGSRRLDGLRTVNMPLFRRVTTKAYSIFMRLITGFPVTDGTNGYRAIKTSLFRDARINMEQEWLNRYELEPYLFYQAIVLGYRVCEAPVTKIYHADDVGYTKMVPFLDWWRIARPLIFLRIGYRK
ncbi:MAG: glycosyltransferase family 2 protein [Planctomycetes bacterium]|nr:glycosyltransferase family 2 protein [Planctomycetota bacterium]